MVKSFLEGRRMKMRLGDASSDLVAILRGSPQGNVLGPILYCATTQRLVGPAPPLPAGPTEGSGAPEEDGVARTDNGPVARRSCLVSLRGWGIPSGSSHRTRTA